MHIRTDIFSWIPQPEVPNPLADLPGGARHWGDGASGPFFGGDDLRTPPAGPDAWISTYRAKQSLAFSFDQFGDQPVEGPGKDVQTGLTTVLTKRRSEGGQVCHSLKATVQRSAASVKWDADAEWYEVRMIGAAQDPVPAATVAAKIGERSGRWASALTPDLAWDVVLRFDKDAEIGMATRSRYVLSSAFPRDASQSLMAPKSFGEGSGLLHGLVTVRMFPSYVVYVTMKRPEAKPITMPIFFTDASTVGPVTIPEMSAKIAVALTEPIRQLPF